MRIQICRTTEILQQMCNIKITHPNGQLISKGLFAILKFFQKNERNNSIIVLLGKKTNLFFVFLEESLAWKKHYDFFWPLKDRAFSSAKETGAKWPAERQWSVEALILILIKSTVTDIKADIFSYNLRPQWGHWGL